VLSRKQLKKMISVYKEKLSKCGVTVSNIYLYGSYAKNTARPNSDVDICVISPQFTDRIDATMMMMKLRDDDELLLSPTAFSPETFVDENPLAWEVKQTGEPFVLN
jgi:uncharacterized protein